jgi:hypothetical protein
MADPADSIAAQIRGIEQGHGKPIAVGIELLARNAGQPRGGFARGSCGCALETAAGFNALFASRLRLQASRRRPPTTRSF